jgi:hypothetical protein
MEGKGWDEQRFVVIYNVPSIHCKFLFRSTVAVQLNLDVRFLKQLVERGEACEKLNWFS